MKKLNRKMLWLCVLSGATLCATNTNAKAQEKLSSEEMKETVGSQKLPTKLNALCEVVGTPTCISAVGPSGMGQCFRTQPLAFTQCSNATYAGKLCPERTAGTCRKWFWGRTAAGCTNAASAAVIPTDIFPKSICP